MKRKLGALLELQTGTLHLCLTHDTNNDQNLPNLLPKARENPLHLRALGFFKRETFQQWHHEGGHWLSRHKLQAKLYDPEDGHEITLDELPRDGSFNRAVRVGAKRVRAYLVGQMTPPEALAKRQKRLNRQSQLEQAPISRLKNDSDS